MDRTLHIRWLRIVLWVLAFTAISFGLWALDIILLQKKPIIWISNYSDIVLTIWQTQTTIASLTLASAAFILGKIDKSYYGISIKNLLHLSRHFPKIELSFWEEIICSIVLPAVTWFFVVLDNITATSFLLVLTVYFAVAILVECINVITKSEIYSEWAQKIVDDLVDTVTAPVEEEKQQHREAAKQQLHIVIRGIEAEVSSEIRSGVNLNESTTYWYFVRLMKRYSSEEMGQFNEQMHAVLIEWLRLTIAIKSEQNIHTVLWASYSETLDPHWGSAGIDVFMCSYYHGDVSTSCFQSEIDSITTDILQAYNDYTAKALYILHNAIYYADADTFAQMIKAVWRSQPYHDSKIKSNVLITISAYLYYMAFKEQYIPIEKGSNYLEKLRAFSDIVILESYKCSKPQTIKDILCNINLIFSGVEFLLNFFNDRAFRWEYIPFGTVKPLQLDRDAIEFLTFYCYLFFKDIQPRNFSQIHLDVLLKMKNYMDKIGMINATYAEAYTAFCKWLGREEESTQVNEGFYASLIVAIKKKMIYEAKDIRSKREVWTNKICDMKKDIADHISKSTLYMNMLPTRECCVNLRFCDFHLLKDFSEHHAIYGIKQVIRSNIESRMFYQISNHNMLDHHVIKKTDSFEDSITAFCEVLQRMKRKGININQSYNFPFFDRSPYRNMTPVISETIRSLNTMIQNMGQWETGYSGVSLYIDSTLEDIGFCFPHEDFMTVFEELTDSELKYVCQRYKADDGFLFKEYSNSTEIPFTEEELIEYLKIAMIKIRYNFPAKLPRQKIGFITYYAN